MRCAGSQRTERPRESVSVVLGQRTEWSKVGSSPVRAPPVAAAAKMTFYAKIAVISTRKSSHKTSVITFIYVIHNKVIT